MSSAQRLAEHAPVWLKMGIGADTAPRARQSKLTAAKRLDSFAEVERGLTPAAARAEAARCLQCVCDASGNCDLQRLGIEYDITDNELVIAATKTAPASCAARSPTCGTRSSSAT